MGIPVIDFFAGPGGLGEGFSSVYNKNKKRVFDIKLSIEKEKYAHETLELRSFFRQFDPGMAPAQYYQFLRNEIKRNNLYKLFPVEAEKAISEAYRATLGETDEKELDKRIQKAINGANNWILIGGPPCQAYSVMGRVRQRWKNNLDENDPRVFLYREYYRILAVHNPPVFIMENVKGLLSSRLSDELFFKEIINDLENPVEAYKKLHGKRKTLSDCPGYFLYALTKRPDGYDFTGKPDFQSKEFIIKAEDYGIPQKRHRVIILGIRKDVLNKAPGLLTKKSQIKIDDVINKLPRLRSGLSKKPDGKEKWREILNDFLSDRVSKKIEHDVREYISNVVKNLKIPQKDRGSEFIEFDTDIEYEEERDWFIDQRIGGVCNHSTRSHIAEDLYRYLFAACYAKIKNHSPKLENFPKKLLPKHKNAKEGKFEDRFRVQIYGEPARTITSHIAKDGHYYIHYDPTQCRSLTVREAARIQTFPDNYFFCGPRTSQYIQVGNAVPPLLARQIAEIVSKIFS